MARLDELGILGEISLEDRRNFTVRAHYVYGVSPGLSFGLLRRKLAGFTEGASVGAALGVLLWGAGWSGWLPLVGAHSPPWKQNTPRALLPVLYHAFFGVVWGTTRRLPLRV